MGDPYYYGGVSDRVPRLKLSWMTRWFRAITGPVSGSNSSGYLSSEPLPLASRHVPGSVEFQCVSSDFLRREINPLRPGPYVLEDAVDIGVRPVSSVGGAMAAANGKGYLSPLKYHNLRIQRGDASVSVSSAIPDMMNDRTSPLRQADDPSVLRGE